MDFRNIVSLNRKALMKMQRNWDHQRNQTGGGLNRKSVLNFTGILSYMKAHDIKLLNQKTMVPHDILKSIMGFSGNQSIARVEAGVYLPDPLIAKINLKRQQQLSKSSSKKIKRNSPCNIAASVK